MKKILPFASKEIGEKVVPEYGLTLNLEYRNKIVKYFKNIKERGKSLVMAVSIEEEENQYHVLRDITKEDDRVKFYRKYAVIKVKNSEQVEKLKRMTEEALFEEYFFPY